MKLALTPSPKRTLEIERPDGRVVSFTLKRIEMRDIPKLEMQQKVFTEKKTNGEIDSWEFYKLMLDSIIENFNDEDIADLELDHIMMISESLQKLQREKPKDEKKNQG
jgi:hypothetical protein